MKSPHKLFANCPWENGTEISLKSTVGNYSFDDKKDSNPVQVQADEGDIIPDYINNDSGDIMKAYIPWFLYKPPFGYPRTVNQLQLRQFASNPYIFSVIKTIQDIVAIAEWDIVVKEQYIKEGEEVDEEARSGIKHFFDHPNGNPFETFGTLRRSWIKDLCEIGTFIGVKVFDVEGNFKQVLSRDAGTFLLNTDIYGTIQDRADFIVKPEQDFITTGLESSYNNVNEPSKLQQLNDKVREDTKGSSYHYMYSEQAAYFQYGWTAGARPVPFGKREIIWGQMNQRSNNIYAQSPIEVLWNTILTLVYGGEYNLDFYLNNNLPNGILTMKGVGPDKAKALRSQLSNQIMELDEYSNVKKKHFKVPITGTPLEFTQMQMTSKDMEVIAQQDWFSRILWMCFGVNANELGFIKDVNRSNGETQERAIIRKVVKPYLQNMADAINGQIMPEFGHPEFEFVFTDYDIDDEIKKRTLQEQEIRMGVKTSEMVAEELQIDMDKLKQSLEEERANDPEYNDPTEDDVANGMQEEMKDEKDPEKAKAKAIINLKSDPFYYQKKNLN